MSPRPHIARTNSVMGSSESVLAFLGVAIIVICFCIAFISALEGEWFLALNSFFGITGGLFLYVIAKICRQLVELNSKFEAESD